jgi:hypothetical protein
MVNSASSHVPSARVVREGVVVAVTSRVSRCGFGNEAASIILHSALAAVRISPTLPSPLHAATDIGSWIQTVYSLVVLAGDYSSGTGPSPLVVTPTSGTGGGGFGDSTASFPVATLAGVVSVAATIPLTLQTREDRGVWGGTKLRVRVTARGYRS